uniref:Putative f-box n=1 Tax=Ornithodoros turicata TaxID=34597 RepID=A0A2R5LE02_9ACAR
MPFIGRDWRSPGETWVKTNEGWEKKKILEFYCCAEKGLTDLEGGQAGLWKMPEENAEHDKGKNINDNSCDANENAVCMELESSRKYLQQPFCQITLKCTREVAGYNTISEAFRRLDFQSGIRDIRRFNYICKLLHLLITENLTTLSGCATKVLFTMLEEVAFQVANSQQNIHVLQLLLQDMEQTLRKYQCWGRPLGSTQLWAQHQRTLQRIVSIRRSIQIRGPPSDSPHPQFLHLPPELLREILLKLTDYRDLVNSGKAYPVLQELIDEEYIWHQLCLFHFSPAQLEHQLSTLLMNSPKQSSTVEKKSEVAHWHTMFRRLQRKHGLREEYADSLFLCRHCRCLFWKSFGHPCLKLDDVERGKPVGEERGHPVPICIPVTPQAFLKFFSL